MMAILVIATPMIDAFACIYWLHPAAASLNGQVLRAWDGSRGTRYPGVTAVDGAQQLLGIFLVTVRGFDSGMAGGISSTASGMSASAKP
jgi:hypothetical protein